MTEPVTEETVTYTNDIVTTLERMAVASPTFAPVFRSAASVIDILRGQGAEANAEIARLRADNERLTQLVKELHKSDGELRAQIAALELEVENASFEIVHRE